MKYQIYLKYNLINEIKATKAINIAAILRLVLIHQLLHYQVILKHYLQLVHLNLMKVDQISSSLFIFSDSGYIIFAITKAAGALIIDAAIKCPAIPGIFSNMPT